MAITIYHNPRCSKSRATLALLRDRGIEPAVIEYLDTPPSREELKALLKKLGRSARDVVRTSEAPYRDLKLAQANDEQLIAAMAEHPILIERPIVVNGAKAALGRPPETVLEII
ncbi:MAG: arsenate reductase (glutaredoxin) [Alphaproteobacteria bacterium]|nr:arsenate reductase (glutaredoxin) [Alphaproteobacteria bacterium]